MRGKNKWIALGTLVAGLLVLAVVWLSPSDEPGPAGEVPSAAPIRWNYSVWGPPRAFTAGAERAKEILETASGGRLRIQIHYASALTPAREGLDSIKLGLLESAHICFAYHPMKVPLTHVLALPFLLTEDVRINARVTDAVFRHPDVERDMAERWNAMYLATAVLPIYEFMGNVRVEGVADLAGTRLRVPGDYADLFNQIEAVQVMVTAPETYTAIERGTVDLVAFPWTDSFGAYRLHEVSQYATDGFKIPGSGCMSAVSLDAWAALPESVRAELPRVREEALQAYFDAYEAGDRRWLPEFRQQGVEIVSVPPEARARLVELSRPRWHEWAQSMDARGLAGSEMLQFVQDEIERQRRALAARTED